MPDTPCHNATTAGALIKTIGCQKDRASKRVPRARRPLRALPGPEKAKCCAPLRQIALSKKCPSATPTRNAHPTVFFLNGENAENTAGKRKKDDDRTATAPVSRLVSRWGRDSCAAAPALSAISAISAVNPGFNPPPALDRKTDRRDRRPFVDLLLAPSQSPEAGSRS